MRRSRGRVKRSPPTTIILIYGQESHFDSGFLDYSSQCCEAGWLEHSFTLAVFCKVSLKLVVNETSHTSHNHQVIGKGLREPEERQRKSHLKKISAPTAR